MQSQWLKMRIRKYVTLTMYVYTWVLVFAYSSLSVVIIISSPILFFDLLILSSHGEHSPLLIPTYYIMGTLTSTIFKIHIKLNLVMS